MAVTAIRNEVPPGIEMGRFKCSYMGSILITGMSKPANFILQVSKAIEDRKDEPLPVTLRVSDTGVHLLYGSGEVLVGESALRDLSNINAVSKTRVAYLQRDRKNGTLGKCHLFHVASNSSAMCDLINQACESNVSA